MRNLARKLIDAVQHSLLGSLFSTLAGGVLPVALLVNHLAPPMTALWLVLPVLGLFFLGGFLAWAIGALANRRPRRTSPLHALQLDPPRQLSNGFEAWSELPADGLRPPEAMRWLVTRLGAHPEEEGRWLEVSLGLGTMILIGTLCLVSSDIWQQFYPALAAPSARLLPALVCVAILTAVQIRTWASIQRKLLAQR